MKKDVALYVASSGDIVGERLLNVLRDRRHPKLLNDKVSQPDIRERDNLNEFFREERPEYVFVTAGKSGASRGADVGQSSDYL